MKVRNLCAVVLLLAVSASAQLTWVEKRAAMPKSTPYVGLYQPEVPGFDDQEGIVWNQKDGAITMAQQDQAGTGFEWMDGLFNYSWLNDDGVSTTGPGTGWTVIWLSYNIGKNDGSGLWGPKVISSISCSNGVVTISTPATSAQFLEVGRWISTTGMPAGFSNNMFKVSGTVGQPLGVYLNLYAGFTYNDPQCINGSGTPTTSTSIIINDDLPNVPSRRHAEGLLYDYTRDVFRLTTGVADVNTDATTINGGHSGIADLYEFNFINSAWIARMICGFGSQVATTGVAAPWTPTGGPGQLCGQETPTPTTSGVQVDGIPCRDAGVGGVSNGAGNGGCGIKFPYPGRVEENDVDVLFAGQWNSGPICKTLLYYPATNHYYNVGDPVHGCGTTMPAARWNTAGGRLVPIGNGRLFLFGGPNGSGGMLGDSWILQTYPEAQATQSYWIKVNSTVNPPPNFNPVMDWARSIQRVVLVDYQSPAHIWYFNSAPATLQWSDQGTGAGTVLPSFVTAINNGATLAYNTIGVIDQLANVFVIFNRCGTTTIPACTSSQTQIWGLRLPLALTMTLPANCQHAQVGVMYTCTPVVNGGVTPYTLGDIGALPPGLSFTGTQITGVPTTVGSYSSTISITDSN